MCGSSSDSQSTTNNSTKTEDRTLALNAGGTGISGDVAGSINITNTTSDAGIVKRALDSIDITTATAGTGYSKLLDTTEKLFSAQIAQGNNLASLAQTTLAQAYSDAQTTAKGTIDNKTIVVLAVAGAAALVMAKRKG